MSNTAPKTPFKSTNFWTGIATIVAAAFGYFAVTPDAAAAGQLADTAQSVTEAVQAKNWPLLFGIVINAVNVVTHLVKTYFK